MGDGLKAMKNEILLSQLVGLISATFETKKIQIHSGVLAWYTGSVEKTSELNNGILSIRWARGTGTGCDMPCLYMSVSGFRESCLFKRIVLHAYYYVGDNCNERTRFLYWLMADDVDIIDDLGICGHGSEIGKTYLTRLSANEYCRCMVNANGKTPIFEKGKWKYKEER